MDKIPIQPGGHGPGPGQRLRQLRQHIGWSQAEMARLLGVRPATVSDWERAQVFPAPAQQRALRQLVFNPDEMQKWLMEGGEMPEPQLKTGGDTILALASLPPLPMARFSVDRAGEFLMACRAEWAELLGEACESAKRQQFYPASYVCELVAAMLSGIDICLEATRSAEVEKTETDQIS